MPSVGCVHYFLSTITPCANITDCTSALREYISIIFCMYVALRHRTYIFLNKLKDHIEISTMVMHMFLYTPEEVASMNHL